MSRLKLCSCAWFLLISSLFGYLHLKLKFEPLCRHFRFNLKIKMMLYFSFVSWNPRNSELQVYDIVFSDLNYPEIACWSIDSAHRGRVFIIVIFGSSAYRANMLTRFYFDAWVIFRLIWVIFRQLQFCHSCTCIPLICMSPLTFSYFWM